MTATPQPAPPRPGSFSTLFARNRQRLVDYARRLLQLRKGKSTAEPEDYVHDASAEFLKKPREVRSESHFVYLFFDFVKNAFRVGGRREGAQKRGGAEDHRSLQSTGVFAADPHTGPHTAAGREEVGSLLMRHLQRLKPEYREVILLRLDHDLTWEEIAARMQLDSPDAARKKYNYALGHLRQLVPDLKL
jgi:RNA polymerase sigma factor (sigma-70 family)